jgi:hypothetical protein
MGTAKGSIQQQRPESVIRKGLTEILPTSVQKSYFMLSDAERGVLNTAFEKYRPGRSEPILVGGLSLLKPALRLMTSYRLVIQEVTGTEVATSYTRLRSRRCRTVAELVKHIQPLWPADLTLWNQ